MTGTPLILPPLVLAIDTTSDYASIALVNEAGVVEEVKLHAFEGLGELLFPEIQALLNRHGSRLADISVIAAGWGPGSFTGIRVGLTAAKGLGEATGKQVVGVSRLMAMADFGTKAVRAVVSDARRGEMYAAVYVATDDGHLILRGAEIVVKLVDWLAGAGCVSEFVVDQDLDLPSDLARKQLAEAVRSPRYLAGAVGRIGLKRWRRGQAQDPAEIDASYVRRSDGAMVWTDLGSL